MFQVKLQSLEDTVTQLQARADRQREMELEEEKRLVELELEKERGRLAGKRKVVNGGITSRISDVTRVTKL